MVPVGSGHTGRPHSPSLATQNLPGATEMGHTPRQSPLCPFHTVPWAEGKGSYYRIWLSEHSTEKVSLSHPELFPLCGWLVLIIGDKEDPTEVIQNIYNLRPRSQGKKSDNPPSLLLSHWQPIFQQIWMINPRNNSSMSQTGNIW